MTYATTRARSGLTGEVLFDDRRGTWRDAQSPATEMVVIILRTPLGKCLVRPTLGVDWSRVNKLRTDAPATAQAAVNAALAPLVRDGFIRDQQVTARVFSSRGLLELDVSFIDVRLRAQTRTTLPTITVTV